MKFTGEFFIPRDAEEDINDHAELEIEHKQRYLSILRLVEGRTVLDIASGEGYGTSILATKAIKVFGVDINPELVEHAARKYDRENIRFLNGSADQIPLESNSVDIIVSFETLEHVDAPTQKNFLTEVRRVLRTNGVFIVSTPDKKNYTDRFNHHNSFHVHELYESEFEELLKAHFGHVRIYNQGLEVSSMILDKEHYLSQKPVRLIPVNNAYQFEGKYLIALCSDHSESIQIPIASIVPESEKSYFQLIDRILSLQKEVEELGAWGTRSTAEIEMLRGEIEIVRGEADLARSTITVIEKKNQEEIAVYKETIIEYHNTIRQLQARLAQANHEIFLYEAELEATRQITSQRQSNYPGTEKITESITQLIGVLSENGVRSNPRSVTRYAPADDSSRQIAKLQEDVQWYKRTYEERSLLGVIKQKIASKFHK